MPKPKRIHDLATFDLTTPVVDGDFVTYNNALLFRAGDYAAKNFSMSPDELASAVERFKPVRNELEHINSAGISTVLDGKLGGVDSVRLSDDGTELRGTVKIPRWLDAAWGAKEKQVSAVWDRPTKTLSALGLVIKGHVKGAALFAAFAESESFLGQSVLQRIHDQAAACGAVCDEGNSPAQFHSAEELVAIQAIHDDAVAGGAECRLIVEPDDEEDEEDLTVNNDPDEDDDDDLPAPMFTARKTSPERTRHMQGVHDHIAELAPDACSATFGDKPKQAKAYAKIHALSVENGASCPGSKASMTGHTPKGTTMNWNDKLHKAMFGDDAANVPKSVVSEDKAEVMFYALTAVDETEVDAVVPPVASFADSPEAKRMQKQIDALEAQRENDRKERLRKDAVRFAEDTVRGGRITPALKADFVGLIVRCGEADHEKPDAKVTFTDAAGKPSEGSLTDALMNFTAKMPKRLNDVPAIDPNGDLSKYNILFNDGDTSVSVVDGNPSADERKRLIGMTEAGQISLAAKKS